MRLVEKSYHDHYAYHMEADALRAWIVSTSESVESLTEDIDSLSKEEMERVLVRLNVIVKSCFAFIKPAK